MSRQTPSLPRAAIPCPCATPPAQPVYDLMLAVLPLLRRLEDRGCAALGAHADPSGVTVQVADRPTWLVESWGYVSPPPDMQQAPVRCRAVVGVVRQVPVAIEWTVTGGRRAASC